MIKTPKGKKGTAKRNIPEVFEHLVHAGHLLYIDIHFAGFLCRVADRGTCELELAAALLSRSTRDGNICLPLEDIAGMPFPGTEDWEIPLVFPELNLLHDTLKTSGVVGEPGQYRPLILDNKQRLYLFRYWDYQDRLSRALKHRITKDQEIPHMPFLKEGLERYFSTSEDSEEIDWQKVAALTALMKKFTVISGGPGTGKTTTVAAILGLILELAPTGGVRMALTAPTGKAAARLKDAIERAKDSLNCSDAIKTGLSVETSTLHRILGSIPYSPHFRHNERHRLQVDVAVVDEASMVDLALMTKFIMALPDDCRVILLGDKDQLASVEAGAVLGDICDTGEAYGFTKRYCEKIEEITGYKLSEPHGTSAKNELPDCIVQLTKSHRFAPNSGISRISRAINAGDGQAALELLKHGGFDDIEWQSLPLPDSLCSVFGTTIAREYGGYLAADNIEDAFRQFTNFRILCAVREGPYGVKEINTLSEQILAGKDLIDPDPQWYEGRPVMITRNDYTLRLFNGDVGLAVKEKDGTRRIAFAMPDATICRFQPFRIPAHETVFAMTIHKSQGSEFDRVLIILPDNYSPVLTRELLYTGITRAKTHVTICGTEQVFLWAVSRRIRRKSGLRDALWNSE